MDILKSIMNNKSQEIIYNITYGNNSSDNVIFYDIFYNNNARLNYTENFTEEFNASTFIKRLLNDIKYDNNIKSIRTVITNKKYKDLLASRYFCFERTLSMNDQLLSEVEKVEKEIKMYHLLSSSKFTKYGNFTDKDYSLVNSIVDIINSQEIVNYGYIVNNVSMMKVRSHVMPSFKVHQISSIYSINQDPRSRLISGNVYKGYNFNNNTSKNYIVKTFTKDDYLKNYNFLNNYKTFIRSFPYLVGYILELMSWKYIHKTDEIPNYVYDEIKQVYINNDYKIKEYKI